MNYKDIRIHAAFDYVHLLRRDHKSTEVKCSILWKVIQLNLTLVCFLFSLSTTSPKSWVSDPPRFSQMYVEQSRSETLDLGRCAY